LAAVLVATILIGSIAAGSASPEPNWPQWRGPDLNGVARSTAPAQWSETRNIKWKTPVPGRGFSTPVLWEDRLFLTTAIPTGPTPEPTPERTAGTPGGGRRGGPGGGGGPQAEHRFEVICLDRKTGKILWQRTAKTATPHEGYHRTYGSFASNSPVTDGKRLYAFFGSRGLFCYDLDGKLVWEKDLGVQMRMLLQFGEGTATALDGDRIFLVFDHQEGSFVVALDKHTGKELWRTPREERSSWGTPLVFEHNGRKQLVISATAKVRGYDVQSGKVLWECAGLGANVIPAPVYRNGIVYVMSGFRNPNLMAIRLGREGDLTGTDAIVWSQNRGASYTPSPVLHDNKLYVLTDQGMLSCFNATTGEPYYHQVRLPKSYNFKASPVAADGKLYLATEDSDVVVVKMGETFEVLATNTLPDQVFIASPVIVGGEIFLRSQNNVYCIAE
jgi:outer membrane protein assembly factor BamB